MFSYLMNVLYNEPLYLYKRTAGKPGKLHAQLSCVSDIFSTVVSCLNSMKLNIRLNSAQLSLRLSVNKLRTFALKL